MQAQVIGGVSIRAPVPPEYRSVLTPGALEFIAHLARWVLCCGGGCQQAQLAAAVAARRNARQETHPSPVCPAVPCLTS